MAKSNRNYVDQRFSAKMKRWTNAMTMFIGFGAFFNTPGLNAFHASFEDRPMTIRSRPGRGRRGKNWNPHGLSKRSGNFKAPKPLNLPAAGSSTRNGSTITKLRNKAGDIVLNPVTLKPIYVRLTA